MRRAYGFSKISWLGAALWLAAMARGFAQAASLGAAIELPEVEVVATSPLPSGGENRDNIPAMVQSVPAEDFARTNSPSVTDTLQQQIPGAVSIDVNGNPFSQDLFYRGFHASPRQGTPQGLAVYQNGMRVNEVFGDTVNWDLIPPQAIYRADIFTNNPTFGLNALGGAVSLQMKNGFLWQGLETQVLGGSFGRVSGLFEYGKQIGDYSLYVTGDATRDGGWRLFSPSNLFRLYGDLGYRTPGNELHFTALGARNSLGVIGPTPVLLLDQNESAVFTHPQTTLNEAGTVAFTGKFDINPQWSIASNFYIRTFEQRHTDGNDADLQKCSDNGLLIDPSIPPDSLCLNSNNFLSVKDGNAFVILDRNRSPIPLSPSAIYGTTDRTSIHATTFGTALQATDNDTFFEHQNYFTFGASVDRSLFSFSATSQLGTIFPDLVVGNGDFPGSSSIIATLGRIGYVPTFVTGTTTYYGVYTLDTFNITPELALTAGARLNIAQIVSEDATNQAPELNINDTFSRINPVAGLTYKILPTVTVYGGYSEANRAPTPLELDCASQTRPCIVEQFLGSDPPLKQVVAHTYEAGLRGVQAIFDTGQVDWKAGFFRTDSTNDIISLASTITGRGFFTNVPSTLRQGAEAEANFHYGNLSAYVNYAFIDATYQFSATLASPNNPFADANGNIFVTPGDHIPGIPRHQVKFGGDIAVTPKFKLGADVLVAGAQYFVGDGANQNPKLPLYWAANLHASYQLDEHVQFFGLINNIFNNRNATFGTFFSTGTDAQNATPIVFTNNPRTVTPLQPISFYGGVKVTF
ncbi:MAG: TonB-dependent receptor [Pseudomonadota bacterium]|nr:TonB-dependent receptor [Pseudomonadota bacterium]